MIGEVDFESMKVSRKVVKINDVALPLAIGDKICLTETTGPKTVMGISIEEDGRVKYVLEWLNENGDFMNEALSIQELKLLHKNNKKKSTKVGFAQACQEA